MKAFFSLTDDLPQHWQLKRLKFIARVQTGMAKGKDHGEADTVEVPYLRVANVQDGYLALDDVATMAVPAADLERYRLQPGDVLMNEGGDFDKLGRGHVWHGQIDPCIHQNHVFAVRPHGVSPEWLNAWTGSAPAQFYFMGRAKQSTNLASISSSNVMELPVPVPPPEEQAVRLAFIDRETARIDALIAKKTRFIALLREKRQALITQAVTRGLDLDVPMKDSGVEWLGRVPVHWVVCRLKHVVRLDGGAGFPESEQGRLEGELPFFKVANLANGLTESESRITAEVAASLRAQVFPANSIAFAKVGAALLLNRKVQMPIAGCVDNNMMVAVPKQVDPTWLKWMMTALDMSSIVNPGAIPSVNQEQVGCLSVTVPPTSEQIEVAEFVESRVLQLDRLVEATNLSVDLLAERRSAFITATVTGQLEPCDQTT